MKNDNAKGVDIDGKHYTTYEATQRQRELERKIRTLKRGYLAADASGDAEIATAAAVRLKRARTKYKNFSKSAGLRTQDERLHTTGFGRSAAGKAEWANRKSELTDGGVGGIMGSQGGMLMKITDESIKNVPLTKIPTLSEFENAALRERYRDLLRWVKDKPEGTEGLPGMICSSTS